MIRYICPDCNEPAVKVEAFIKLKPDCGRPALTMVRLTSCASCGLKAAAVWNEPDAPNRSGAGPEGQGYRLPKKTYRSLKWKLTGCNEPGNPDCGCPAHRRFSKCDANGQWNGLPKLDPSPFPMIVAPRPAAQANRIGSVPETSYSGNTVERKPRRAWRNHFLFAYLVSAVVGAVFLAWTLFRLPTDLPRLPEPGTMAEDQLSKKVSSIREDIGRSLPLAGTWLAPHALFSVEDRARGLVAPNRWQRENRSLAQRVDRFNEAVGRVLNDILRAAWLLGAVYIIGLFLGVRARSSPGLGLAVMIVAVPLLAVAAAAGPLLGVENSHLFYWVMPMILSGGGVLLLETGRAMGSGLTGERGDHWQAVWSGLFLIVIGTGLTAAGAAWVAANHGVAVLFTAVTPIVYGFYRLCVGLIGLLRSRGKKGR